LFTIKRVAELQSRQVSFENETARKFDALFSYADEKSFPKQMTFFDGQWFDAYDFLSSLFEKADTSILLIDPYSLDLHLAYENSTFSILR
jgi:hypothetical protein